MREQKVFCYEATADKVQFCAAVLKVCKQPNLSQAQDLQSAVKDL